MKTISARQLRQNPAEMIRDVESGESYSLTVRGRRVGTIVPEPMQARVIPPKKTGPVDISVFTRHELASSDSVDELLDELKGDW